MSWLVKKKNKKNQLQTFQASEDLRLDYPERTTPGWHGLANGWRNVGGGIHLPESEWNVATQKHYKEILESDDTEEYAIEMAPDGVPDDPNDIEEELDKTKYKKHFPDPEELPEEPPEE